MPALGRMVFARKCEDIQESEVIDWYSIYLVRAFSTRRNSISVVVAFRFT